MVDDLTDDFTPDDLTDNFSATKAKSSREIVDHSRLSKELIEFYEKFPIREFPMTEFTPKVGLVDWGRHRPETALFYSKEHPLPIFLKPVE